ncbi:Uncharacterized protein TCAP_04711 [Tolypocladium capitatum]|uniref:Acetylserotonin methytransferase-like protein n=1 Tax=Tolypocladium capitatum TaxID=45235 RepID=A0A2K3QCU4_9HYPO|nr:Uncharacterized protein TCAP_04711 [Tolypocladium capitatum]
MSPQQQQGGFSLFPSPNSSKRPRPITPQRGRRRSGSQERSAPTPPGRDGRAATPERPRERPSLHITPPRNSRPVPPQLRVYTSSGNWPLDGAAAVPVQQPREPADVPARTDTSFSQAITLVRSNSGRSRSSIAQLPLRDDGPAAAEPPARALRSIFPTYNPELPLDQQAYAPAQMSPSRIPRAVLSRRSYYEEPPEPEPRGPRVRIPVRSAPRPAPGSTWPARHQSLEPPVVPRACTTEQLQHLWKIANGWRASSSEGRVYCLQLARARDAPVYTLSSASSQPFYHLRLDPTSVSAYVTLTRHDPSKKAPRPDVSPSSGGGGSRASDTKNWHVALATTLEDESRRQPPNDGLVALLMPAAATRMAQEKADDPAAVMMAERECARLVWDEDTAAHFLVHQALATPFCVTVERSPAYSRTEYTLEHHESPRHLAKLTRDGTGGGWIEVDTGIASKIESFYIIDVAVTALLLVAAADDRNAPAPLETFSPPPVVLAAGRRKTEAFELDVESQDSLGKGRRRSREAAKDKLPFLIRVVIKLSKALFKCLVWVLTIAFKCMVGVFKLLYKCVGSKY